MSTDIPVKKKHHQVSRPIPRGSRRPEFQAKLSGPHPLAAAHRGLVRQVSRPHKLRRLKGDRRHLFGIGLRQRRPVVQRIQDWWQSRSKNKYDRQSDAAGQEAA